MPEPGEDFAPGPFSRCGQEEREAYGGSVSCESFQRGAVGVSERGPTNALRILLAGTSQCRLESRWTRDAAKNSVTPATLLGELAVIDGQPNRKRERVEQVECFWGARREVSLFTLKQTRGLRWRLLEAYRGNSTVRETTLKSVNSRPLDTMGASPARIVELTDPATARPQRMESQVTSPPREGISTDLDWRIASGVAAAFRRSRAEWVRTERRELLVRGPAGTPCARELATRGAKSRNWT